MEASWIVLAITSTINTIGGNSIDFVTELPGYDGYGTIMICIDQLSKIIVLVP